MDKRLQTLRLRQIDQSLKHWREALGMSATALGRLMGMTGNGVRKLESAEAQQVITLASLALEDQAVKGQPQRELLAQELLDGPRRAFW